MNKRPVRIWVDKEFAKFIKVRSASNGKNIIDYSKDLIKTIEDKADKENKKDERYKFSF